MPRKPVKVSAYDRMREGRTESVRDYVRQQIVRGDERPSFSALKRHFDLPQGYHSDAGLVVPDKVAYHRNGVGGTGFTVITFRVGRDDMVGVVFPGDGNVAVFDRKKLGEGVIESGENSWRGDIFEPALRSAIEDMGV